MTAYDHCHIGHARVLLVFDAFVRYLRAQNYRVKYVRNITDIDDKIIKKALEAQVDYRDITKKYIDFMHEDERNLGLLSPDAEPRATDYIAEMIAMIERLIEKGCAYQLEGGDVYFAVEQFSEYGKLARKDLDALVSGARVDAVLGKQSPHDFVLWKMAKADEPSWPSPWGAGRPGWHIECSAMSTSIFSQTLTIHGGGIDLIFPNENEVAQTEACCGYVCAIRDVCRPRSDVWYQNVKIFG